MVRYLLSKIINSNRNLAITFGLIIFSSAVAYSTSEKTALIDGVWWSIVTATTVGYGDSFPHNMLGKITAIVLMLSMVLLIIPAITARMASGLIVNHDAFTHLEQEELKQGIRKILAYIESEKETQTKQGSTSNLSHIADDKPPMEQNIVDTTEAIIQVMKDLPEHERQQVVAVAKYLARTHNGSSKTAEIKHGEKIYNELQREREPLGCSARTVSL